MALSLQDVFRFAQEQDVKFIRLAFCDMFGALKNISVMTTELPRVIENGISFDPTMIRGFPPAREDLYLHPDLDTLTILPWRPSQGRVIRMYCHIRHADGRAFAGDGRALLRRTAEQLKNKGYLCKIGPECEFYLFEVGADGNPTRRPQDMAGYFDVSPLDRGENVRRDICLTLEEMGIQPENSHHEQGPGQNEIDFHHSDALAAADQLVSFRNVVKSIAARNGLFASFMPKPLPASSGSGLHINISISKSGYNIFRGGTGKQAEDARHFIAGVLNRVAETTAVLNPLTNSYRRFGTYEAPEYITWCQETRSQLVRIPAAKGEYARMELRSPDPACNPYLAFALLIRAGVEGLEQKLPLAEPANFDLRGEAAGTLDQYRKLPATLGEALTLAENSRFLRDCLPAELVTSYIAVKKAEWQAYLAAEDKDAFEQETYFATV
ncbi:MAG: glutamine synthetase family protein [Gracilibacteraceae bacterium]|jgi:glutamine synthetase|nr:glutamine synthetase family protein [Gracilibacteraceae bacterium]